MGANNDTGKILPKTFEDTIWKQTGSARSAVISGPRYGVDVSVVKLPNGMALASASDPLSLIPTLGLAESAWLSVHLTANDLATTGHAPMYAQFVLNLPTWISDEDFKTYWHHIHSYCKAIGVSITGGHTGKIPGQESTIAGGATFSLVAPADSILTSSKAGAGQSILVTKGCAISSTAILAMSFPQTVKNKLGPAQWQQGCEQFYRTSVLPDALAAAATGKVTAMHDVTEGGVYGAVYELCGAAGCGAIIHEPSVPIGGVSGSIADLFGFDAKRAVGAGAMLMTCHPDDAQPIIQHLAGHDISSYAIGETVEVSKGIHIEDKNGNSSPLEVSANDPYWGAYFSALKKGWK